MLATSNQIPFIRTNRHVGEESLALTHTMTRVSIRPCHAYEYMVEQSRGYRRVGFTVKDLYNNIEQQRRTTPFESDSEGALSYMNALATKDLHFFCRFMTDSEDRMVDMFWPLVLFVRMNNHRGSNVFGAALLSDETVETYTWLLRKFLDSMNGKMPKAIITDRDKVMRTAIQTVMPEARHRLCIWHIGQNANGHLKSAEKLKAFNREIMKEAHITLKQGTKCHEDGSRVYKGSAMSSHVLGDEKRKHLSSSQVTDSEEVVEGRKKCLRNLISRQRNAPRSRASEHTKEGYNMLKMEIDRLAVIMEGLARDQEKVQGTATPTKKGSIVRDPVPSKTKGREKSDKNNEPSRRTVTCGYCKGGGHNIQTCQDSSSRPRTFYETVDAAQPPKGKGKSPAIEVDVEHEAVQKKPRVDVEEVRQHPLSPKSDVKHEAPPDNVLNTNQSHYCICSDADVGFCIHIADVTKRPCDTCAHLYNVGPDNIKRCSCDLCFWERERYLIEAGNTNSPLARYWWWRSDPESSPDIDDFQQASALWM
ncbi:hypothetical protein ACLB2K_062969 [Fragaria x ananassa]